MRFRLIYEGEIAPRQRVNIKAIHEIRMSLHQQIRRLWDHPPLSDSRDKLLIESPPPQPGDVAIMERRNGILFAPLVTQNNNLNCELSIILLRQQGAGQLIGDGGDIDNRVKTLLDALRMPSNAEAQQAGVADIEGMPIHCLLQDDNLVTKIDVETDRLLRPANNHFDLVAIISVNVRVSRLTWANIGLAS